MTPISLIPHPRHFLPHRSYPTEALFKPLERATCLETPAIAPNWDSSDLDTGLTATSWCGHLVVPSGSGLLVLGGSGLRVLGRLGRRLGSLLSSLLAVLRLTRCLIRRHPHRAGALLILLDFIPRYLIAVLER